MVETFAYLRKFEREELQQAHELTGQLASEFPNTLAGSFLGEAHEALGRALAYSVEQEELDV